MKEAVTARRRCSSEVFVFLAHRPGEAQFDFGQAEVILDGQISTVALFVMYLVCTEAVEEQRTGRPAPWPCS